jgi:hypothetical protein
MIGLAWAWSLHDRSSMTPHINTQVAEWVIGDILASSLVLVKPDAPRARWFDPWALSTICGCTRAGWGAEYRGVAHPCVLDTLTNVSVSSPYHIMVSKTVQPRWGHSSLGSSSYGGLDSPICCASFQRISTLPLAQGRWLYQCCLLGPHNTPYHISE